MAMVLSGVDDIVSKYARLKYAGQQNYFIPVLFHVYKHILGLGWKFPNKDFPKRLAALALREAVMSDMCPRCNGKGEISTGMKVIECFSCEELVEPALEDAVQPGSHGGFRPVRERHRGCVEETPSLNRFPFSLKPIIKECAVCTPNMV